VGPSIRNLFQELAFKFIEGFWFSRLGLKIGRYFI